MITQTRKKRKRNKKLGLQATMKIKKKSLQTAVLIKLLKSNKKPFPIPLTTTPRRTVWMFHTLLSQWLRMEMVCQKLSKKIWAKRRPSTSSFRHNNRRQIHLSNREILWLTSKMTLMVAAVVTLANSPQNTSMLRSSSSSIVTVQEKLPGRTYKSVQSTWAGTLNNVR
jgi:hypothetical protein